MGLELRVTRCLPSMGYNEDAAHVDAEKCHANCTDGQLDRYGMRYEVLLLEHVQMHLWFVASSESNIEDQHLTSQR